SQGDNAGDRHRAYGEDRSPAIQSDGISVEVADNSCKIHRRESRPGLWVSKSTGSNECEDCHWKCAKSTETRMLAPNRLATTRRWRRIIASPRIATPR